MLTLVSVNNKGQDISTNIWQIIGTRGYNNTNDDDNNNNDISYILIFDAWHSKNSQQDKHLISFR